MRRLDRIEGALLRRAAPGVGAQAEALVDGDRRYDYRSLAQGASIFAHDLPEVAGGDAPAIILYTSGSTGKPKGILVSHANLLAGARIVAGYVGIRSDERILGVLPLSFDYGLNQLLTAVHRGCTLVLQR